MRITTPKLLIYDGDNLVDTIDCVANKQPYSLLLTRLYNCHYCHYGSELLEKAHSMAPMLEKIVAYIENPDYSSTLKNAGIRILQAIFESGDLNLSRDFGIVREVETVTDRGPMSRNL